MWMFLRRGSEWHYAALITAVFVACWTFYCDGMNAEPSRVLAGFECSRVRSKEVFGPIRDRWTGDSASREYRERIGN